MLILQVRQHNSSMKTKRVFFVFFILNILHYSLFAQTSPGELSRGHAQLEGVNNCTKCHTTGSNVSIGKCLDCHKEIRISIENKKGFHSTPEVRGKSCTLCHNEHHGRNFDLIRLNKKTFQHDFTGFPLEGTHATKDCRTCHKSEFIKNPAFKNKRNTFMGLNSSCLSCHTDFHQSKLSTNCTSCHNFDSFEGAKVTGFDHSKTKFALIGKHATVGCIQCHKTETVNSKTVQKFSNLQFASCSSCHKDPHESRLGFNCASCHNTESFRNAKNSAAFSHDKTGFPLTGRHKAASCTSCHKSGSMTTPIAHARCSDCHTDYHKGEFKKNGVSPDCLSCHTTEAFSPATFTIEQHNKGKFKLKGAHLATACNECHQKQDGWRFKNIKSSCVNCHQNIHKGFMSEKFIANEKCESCHNMDSWKNVTFDHEQTDFKLEGKHARKSCSACHFKRNETGARVQKFMTMNKECNSCHKDNHVGQFAENGKTDCTRCHTFEKWEESKFDHNTSRFKLEGKHKIVDCKSCHKFITDGRGTFVKYKFKSVDCVACHV